MTQSPLEGTLADTVRRYGTHVYAHDNNLERATRPVLSGATGIEPVTNVITLSVGYCKKTRADGTNPSIGLVLGDVRWLSRHNPTRW